MTQAHGSRFVDLTGKRFHRWLAVAPSGTTSDGKVAWLCECECGTRKVVSGASLRKGITKSCGCWNREALQKRATHGQSGTDTHNIWLGMVRRCKNENSPSWQKYGGRGIRVCRRWLKFKNFLADMGERPPGLTIERTNNNGHYTPKNCKWATYAEQSMNRRNTLRMIHAGVEVTLLEFMRLTGMNYSAAYRRATGVTPMDSTWRLKK